MVNCDRCKNSGELCSTCKHGELFEYDDKPEKTTALVSKLGGYYCPHCSYRVIINGVCERCGAELVDESGNPFSQ